MHARVRTHTNWHDTFSHVKGHARLHAVTRTPLTSPDSVPCRFETAQVTVSATPAHTHAHTPAHTRTQASPARARSEKCWHERRRTLWRGRRPRSGSVLGSGGGGRGRRRWSRSALRSRRSRQPPQRRDRDKRSPQRSCRRRVLSARGTRSGAETRFSTADSASRLEQSARNPRAPGSARPAEGSVPPARCRRPRTKAPGEDVAPSARGIGRAQDGRGVPLGMRRGPRVRAAQSQGAARSP